MPSPSTAWATSASVAVSPDGKSVYVTSLLDADRLDEAEATFRTGRERAESLGLTSQVPPNHWGMVGRHFFGGGWDAATAVAEAGLGLADDGIPRRRARSVGLPCPDTHLARRARGGRASSEGEGLTNSQIGERMFISRCTVQTHLAHAFQKTGCATRTELAAEAARRG